MAKYSFNCCIVAEKGNMPLETIKYNKKNFNLDVESVQGAEKLLRKIVKKQLSFWEGQPGVTIKEIIFDVVKK